MGAPRGPHAEVFDPAVALSGRGKPEIDGSTPANGEGSRNSSDGKKYVTQQPYAPPPVPPTYAPPAQGQQQYGQPQGQAYPQAQQGQPGFGAPPAPAKKPFYKRTWFLILAGLTVLAIIMNAANGGDAENTGSATGAAPDDAASDVVAEAEAPEGAEFGLGQPAPDGDFSFVVSGVDCSLTEIGDQYFGTKAQGQFCVVSVAVTNKHSFPSH